MSETNQGIVRVGPAGWSYEDWKGIVYPPDMPRSRHALAFLCQYFDTIEINTSFYRPLNPKHCLAWLRHVASNERFKFTAKLWRRFTHERESWPADSEIAQVQSGLEPLLREGRLGALLIQFPWSFKRAAEERSWLSRITDTFADYPLAVELRHASWNRPEVYTGLSERGIAFCNIDQPMFRDSLPPTGRVTARVGYVRLHGRNYDDWFREDAGRDDRYDYLYSEEELKPWLEKINQIRQAADEVYVITNNHYRGQAVVNAFEIAQALGLASLEPPPDLVRHYPSCAMMGLGDGYGEGTGKRRQYAIAIRTVAAFTDHQSGPGKRPRSRRMEI